MPHCFEHCELEGVYNTYQSTLEANKMNPKKEGQVTIKRGGKEYSGRYRIHRGLLTVNSTYGAKTTQVFSHGSDPIPLAEMLLREIIKGNIKQ